MYDFHCAQDSLNLHLWMQRWTVFTDNGLSKYFLSPYSDVHHKNSAVLSEGSRKGLRLSVLVFGLVHYTQISLDSLNVLKILYTVEGEIPKILATGFFADAFFWQNGDQFFSC